MITNIIIQRYIVMGAVKINGEFSSSDWEATIESIKSRTRIYRYNERGELKEDEWNRDYGGNILSINDWKFIKMHNASEKEIIQEINKFDERFGFVHFDKWQGVVAEGQIVGYNLYTPLFLEVITLPFDYSPYTKLGKFSLLEYSKKKGHEKIDLIKQGSLDECKDWANWKLFNHVNSEYVISSFSGTQYICYNKVKKVKTTTRESKSGVVSVKEVHNYYWAGLAAC